MARVAPEYGDVPPTSRGPLYAAAQPIRWTTVGGSQ